MGPLMAPAAFSVVNSSKLAFWESVRYGRESGSRFGSRFISFVDWWVSWRPKEPERGRWPAEL